MDRLYFPITDPYILSISGPISIQISDRCIPSFVGPATVQMPFTIVIYYPFRREGIANNSTFVWSIEDVPLQYLFFQRLQNLKNCN